MRRTLNFLACCGTLFGVTLADLAVAANPLKTPAECQLSMGVSNWLPYQKISEKGKPGGLQIELIQRIAKQAGCQLSYKSMTFQEGLVELKNGTTDFQMNATPSAERRQYANFSRPYRNEFLLLYATSKYQKKCQTMSLEDLIYDGFKLGLQKGLVYGEKLQKIQQTPSLNSKITYVNSNVQHLQLVVENNLDGIVDDPVVVSYRSTVNYTGKALSSCPIVVSSAPISLIFSKKTVPETLVAKFDQAILKVMESDYYQNNWAW